MWFVEVVGVSIGDTDEDELGLNSNELQVLLSAGNSSIVSDLFCPRFSIKLCVCLIV